VNWACEGKIAIVTGAAGSGMGRSIALTLAREGAKVIVNYRASQGSAKAIVDHIKSSGGSAIAIEADVFEADGCKKLVDAASEQFGPIDKLDSSAALDDVHQEIAPLFHLMPLVLPGMYRRKWGRLIGIALHPTKLPPAYSYDVGKAARVQAMHGLRIKRGVTKWPSTLSLPVPYPRSKT
jgi:NAD(P)-dependent dehydrogenase (short-subunit alcohol dehydrogenase family)